MPKINRSSNTYVPLPSEFQTKSLTNARLQFSLNVTIPAGWESYFEKVLKDLHKDISKSFDKAVRKKIEKESK